MANACSVFSYSHVPNIFSCGNNEVNKKVKDKKISIKHTLFNGLAAGLCFCL